MRLNTLFLSTLLIWGTSTGCSRPPTAAESVNRSGLQSVAETTFATPAGQQGSLREYRGKVVLLHFFASWCKECSLESSSLRSLHASFKHTPFSIIGVAVDDDPFEMQKFVLKNSLPFPIFMDTGGELKEFFQVREIPSTLVLDKRGQPVNFRDPQSGETTAKIIGTRAWDSVETVQMLAHLVERP
jgi:peroxiredoxin